MAKINTLIIILIAFLQVNAQNPSLEIEFTTVDMGGFSHEKHVLAVWIETETIEFVKTQLVYADVRKGDLYTWNKAPVNGNEVDAITGATQLDHKTYTISWNCLDLDGNTIPNGNYVLHIEMNNKHSQGPLAEIGFTINGNSFTLNPNDEDFFKNISLKYQPNYVSVNDIIEQENDIPIIYPNPANDYLNLEHSSDCNISFIEIFNIHGELVKSNRIENNKKIIRVKSLSDGVYIIRIQTDKGLVIKKMIKH